MKSKSKYFTVTNPETGVRTKVRKYKPEKITYKKYIKPVQKDIEEELYWLGAEQQYQQKEPGVFVVPSKKYGWGGAVEGAAQWGVTGGTVGSIFGPIGTVVGTAAGIVGGGISGWLAEDQEVEEMRAMERNIRTQNLNKVPVDNEYRKRRSAARVFMNGGSTLPEEEYEGLTHDSDIGGIPIDSMGNPALASGREVTGYAEDGEVMWNSYIFSNNKDLAKASKNKKTYAQRAKFIMEKYKNFEDKMSQDEKNSLLAQLKQEQESLRESLGLTGNNKFAMGGDTPPQTEEELIEFYNNSLYLKDLYSRNNVLRHAHTASLRIVDKELERIYDEKHAPVYKAYRELDKIVTPTQHRYYKSYGDGLYYTSLGNSPSIKIKDEKYNIRNNLEVPTNIIDSINSLGRAGNLSPEELLTLHAISLNESEYGRTRDLFGATNIGRDYTLYNDTTQDQRNWTLNKMNSLYGEDTNENIISFIKRKTDNFQNLDKYNPYHKNQFGESYSDRINKHIDIIKSNPDLINAIYGNNDVAQYEYGGFPRQVEYALALQDSINNNVTYGDLIGNLALNDYNAAKLGMYNYTYDPTRRYNQSNVLVTPDYKYDANRIKYTPSSPDFPEKLELRNEYDGLTTAPEISKARQTYDSIKSGIGEYMGPIIGGLSGIADIARSMQKPDQLNPNAYMVQPNVKPMVFSNEELKRDIEGQAGATRYLAAGQSPTLRMATNVALTNSANRAMAGATESIMNANQEAQFKADMVNKDIEGQNARYRLMADDYNMASRAAKEHLLDRGIDTIGQVGNLLTMKQLYDKRIKGDRNYINEEQEDKISKYLNNDAFAANAGPTTTATKFSPKDEGVVVGEKAFNSFVEAGERENLDYLNNFDFSSKSLSQITPDNFGEINHEQIANSVRAVNSYIDYKNPSYFTDIEIDPIPKFSDWQSANPGKELPEFASTVLLPAVKQVSAKFGIHPGLMASMISVESRGNTGAYNSTSGASGLAQFVKTTAAEMGVDPFNPNSALIGMARYIKYIDGYLKEKTEEIYDKDSDQYLNWTNSGGEVPAALIAAAYNWGIGNIKNNVITPLIEDGYSLSNPEINRAIYDKLMSYYNANKTGEKNKQAKDAADYINLIFKIV